MSDGGFYLGEVEGGFFRGEWLAARIGLGWYTLDKDLGSGGFFFHSFFTVMIFGGKGIANWG